MPSATASHRSCVPTVQKKSKAGERHQNHDSDHAERDEQGVCLMVWNFTGGELNKNQSNSRSLWFC